MFDPKTTEKLDRATRHLGSERNSISLQPSFYGEAPSYLRDAYHELVRQFERSVIAKARELAEADQRAALAELGLGTAAREEGRT